MNKTEQYKQASRPVTEEYGDDTDLNTAAEKSKKLLLTWLVGAATIVICVLYGDTAQLVLAAFIAVYLYFKTKSYLKLMSSLDS